MQFLIHLKKFHLLIKTPYNNSPFNFSINLIMSDIKHQADCN
jgi:hypothetical protein